MFKVPSNIPQDLLLIHDLVSEPIPGPSSWRAEPKEHADESDESSSDSDSIASSSNSDTSNSDSDSDEAKAVESLLTGNDDSAQTGDVKFVYQFVSSQTKPNRVSEVIHGHNPPSLTRKTPTQALNPTLTKKI